MTTTSYDQPVPCSTPSCTGVVQCLGCDCCFDCCPCDMGEIDSGPSGPTASDMAGWQRLK